MLDLDSLAESRARALNQGHDVWRAAVWSPAFQELSQTMSDGEVEAFIKFCPSVTHFEAAVRFLKDKAASTDKSPFKILVCEAESVGLKPDQWILSKLGKP